MRLNHRGPFHAFIHFIFKSYENFMFSLFMQVNKLTFLYLCTLLYLLKKSFRVGTMPDKPTHKNVYI